MLRVLNEHSLDTRALLYPESMGLNLSERDSTANPTVDRDAPQLQMGDWVQDMDEPGAGIVWRVRTADTQYNTETITYTLEHMINSLADRILPDEVKASDMGGSGDYCTAKQAAQYILGKQSDWVLGDFEYNVSNPYRFSGETLKAALETVSNSLEDPVWEYDFTVYPFRLHIRQLSDAVDSELRADRNLTTLKYTIDRTRMYTRFYPVGKNNLKPAGKYVSKNEATYGRVDKTETDQSKDTEAKLIAWANERLKRHAEPLVTVTISGLDLSESTGESLDKVKISRYKCRVPLPAYSTTIVEKVTKLSWRDKIKDKESVTVTLANALADIQSIIKEEKSKGGGGSRTAAELNYGIETTIGNVESGLYTRITQTAYEIRQEAHDESRSLRSIISQTAESIRLMVEDDVSSLRSQIIQTAESIRLEVENTAESLRSSITQTAESIRLEVENTAESLRSSITQTAESIRMEVADEASSIRSEIVQTAASIRAEVSDESASIRSVITQTASSIRSEVTNEAASIRSSITQTAASIRSEVESTADSLRSAITQEHNRISLVVEGTGDSASVKRAAIILAINGEGGSTAHIDADQVYIGNQKSTTVIAGKCVLSDVSADYIAGKIATIPTLSGIVANFSGNITSGGALSGYQVYADSRNISNPIMGVAITGPVNNVYTLTATKADGTYNNFTFSRATTLTGAWSGGTYTVTASPQGDQAGTTIGKKGESWSGNTCTVTVGYENPISGAMVSTGCVFDIDASGRDAASGAASGRHGSSYSWDFVITRGDGSTKQLVIDCSDIYTAARDGYTLGTFTLADITLQGDADTVYKEVSSGGTNYYTAGTAATYYKGGTTGNYYTAGSGTKYDRGDSVTAREVVSSGGTVFYTAGTAGTYYDAGTAVTVYPGDGGSFTVQGTAAGDITEIGTAYWYKQHSSTETPTGTWYTQHSSQPSGTYYKRFAAGTTHKGLRNAGTTTKYARGTGYSITPIGTSHSITPIGSTSVRLGSAGTYYKGNGGAFTPQGTAVSVTARGDSVSVTPISGTAKMLASTTRYKAGTRYQSTYYTKS